MQVWEYLLDHGYLGAEKSSGFVGSEELGSEQKEGLTEVDGGFIVDWDSSKAEEIQTFLRKKDQDGEVPGKISPSKCPQSSRVRPPARSTCNDHVKVSCYMMLDVLLPSFTWSRHGKAGKLATFSRVDMS